MSTHRNLLRILSVSTGLVAVGAAAQMEDHVTKPTLGEWGVETNYINEDVDPGDDFYAYLNEGWEEANELPQGFSSITSFLEVMLRTETQLREMMDDLLAGKTDGVTGAGQLVAFYDSYVDEERINELGMEPIQAALDDILATQDKSQFAARLMSPGQTSPVGYYVSLDAKNPTTNVLIFEQSGISLPQQFYVTDGEPYSSIIAAYTDHIEAQFNNAGVENARARAEKVVAFETLLAGAHWTPAEARDRVRKYHPMDRGELEAYAPGLDWGAMLNAAGIGGTDYFIVEHDTAIQKTAALIGASDLDTLVSYQAFMLINNAAPLLSEEFEDENFDFFSRTLSGTEEQRPRDVMALQYTSAGLGELMGRAYVERFFPASTKAEMEKYIPYIEEAFAERVAASDWMDDPTRAEANHKLETFNAKIGYPDHWRDYSALEIRDDDLFGNITRIREFKWEEDKAMIGQPRREWVWYMNPQDINAYYTAPRNEIVFPAAILQAPFFDPAADPAVNFAAIGGVIGHEMGHGFDDQGSKVDGDGVLRDWWTQEARASFNGRAEMLAAQYDQYEPLPGLHVNGHLTLGENIGDLSGITMAYTAWRKFADEEYGGNPPVIDGLTGDQRFFLAWAQLWRSESTEGALRNRVLGDPHSPGMYRVNGIVRNVAPWYDAFDVEADDELYLPPEERVTIW